MLTPISEYEHGFIFALPGFPLASLNISSAFSTSLAFAQAVSN
jgi:hypothetical protein